MDRRGLLLLSAACALAGCNAIFGITGGQPTGGSGGASGSATTASTSATSTSTSAMSTSTSATSTSSNATSSSTSATSSSGTGGGCNVYAGDGVTYFTDVGDAATNIPTLTMGNGTSITGTYYSQQGYTELKLGAIVAGYCDIGSVVDITGPPAPGDYTIVAASPYSGVSFFSGPKNAYVFASADLEIPDGGCDANVLAFGSVAGTGKVTIVSVQGMTVKFTVSGVLANGISDPTCAGMGFPCDGQGTLQIDVKGGESDCFQMN